MYDLQFIGCTRDLKNLSKKSQDGLLILPYSSAVDVFNRLEKRKWKQTSNNGISDDARRSINFLADNDPNTFFIVRNSGYLNWFEIDFGTTIIAFAGLLKMK